MKSSKFIKHIILTFMLLSFLGNSSFLFPSEEGQKQYTNELFLKMKNLLLKTGEAYQFEERKLACWELVKSGFSLDSRTISDDSGIRFRMNLDHLLHLLERVQGKSVAILGCSSGEEGLLALLFGASEVILSDISQNELKTAQSLYAKFRLKTLCPKSSLHLLKGDCLRASLFKEQQFDFVLAHNLVHFFDGKQMAQFKILVAGMTKPGSYLYMTANPCSYTRYKKLRNLRSSNPKDTQLRKTIGKFNKKTLAAINPRTRKQNILLVTAGYDEEGEEFYQDHEFPYNGNSVSRPLPGSIKTFRTPSELEAFKKQIKAYAKKMRGKSPNTLIEENLQNNEVLFGFSDERLRRVFTPYQLAELFAGSPHDLFEVISCAFFNPNATTSAPQGELPVQAYQETENFPYGEIPECFLEASKTNIIAQPCVILRAVTTLKPIAIFLGKEHHPES